MVDARIPERWLMDRRLRRLSDSAFRTFVVMLVLSVGSRSDGLVEEDDLEDAPGARRADAEELVAAKLWKSKSASRWVILDWASTQTSKSELERLENVRRADRLRKQRQRERERTEAVPDGHGDSHRDAFLDDRHEDESTGQHRQAGRPGRPGRPGTSTDQLRLDTGSPEDHADDVPDYVDDGAAARRWETTARGYDR